MYTPSSEHIVKVYPPKDFTLEYLLKQIKDEKHPSLEWRFHCLHQYIKARLFYIPNVRVEYGNRSDDKKIDVVITIWRPKKIVGPLINAYRMIILRGVSLNDPETIIDNMFKQQYAKK